MVKVIRTIVFWLVIIGALNWGLIGLFNFDLVAFLFGELTLWSKIIYATVGISAIVYGSMVYMLQREYE